MLNGILLAVRLAPLREALALLEGFLFKFYAGTMPQKERKRNEMLKRGKKQKSC